MSSPEKALVPVTTDFDKIISTVKPVTSALPTFTPSFYDELKSMGVGGIGVALAIFNSWGYLLLAEHKITSHNTYARWGTVSETVKGSNTSVEPVLETASRGIREELGVDPNDLGLRQYGPHAATISMWPRLMKQQKILAITLPLYISPEGEANIPDFPNTEEILRTEYFNPHSVDPQLRLREGTPVWLQHLGELGLYDRDVSIGDAVDFPGPMDYGTMVDLDDSRQDMSIELP